MFPRSRLAVILGSKKAATTSDGANLKTNLVAWWALDEASNGTGAVSRADSQGANTLTDNNTTASGTGVKGNGADFEADNAEYLSIADNAAVSMGDIDFTLAGWAKFESAPANTQSRTLLAKWNYSANKREYALQWERQDGSARNHIVFKVSSAGTGATATALNASTLGLPSTATWYFIVAWHDATANTLNIQVNNGTVDSTAHNSGAFDSDSTLLVGTFGAPDAGQYMDGILDEMAIWKRKLTPAERTWLYNSGSGRAYSEIG